MVGQTSVVALPLTRFMNHLSLVESIRVRVRQDLLGLERLAGSKCPFHVEELIEMNYKVLTGVEGRRAVQDFCDLLLQPPNSSKWCPFFGVSYVECAPLILQSMVDTLRRVVMPQQSWPWQMFRVVFMEAEEGLEFLRRQHRHWRGCSLCKDRCFANVSWFDFKSGLWGRTVAARLEKRIP